MQRNAECLPNTKRILMKLGKFSFDKSFTLGSGRLERRLISQGVARSRSLAQEYLQRVAANVNNPFFSQ